MLRGIAIALLLTVAACASQPANVPAAPALSKVPTASILSAADAARDSGRFAEALQIYQEVLVSEPKSAAAQFGIAECLLGLGKADQARPMFEALKKDETLHASAIQGEGLAFLALGQREPAAEMLHEATSADPSQWRAWNALGFLADMKRDPTAAQEAYAHALTARSDSAVLHNNVGYSQLLAGKPDAAIAEFRKALTLDPSSETVQNNYRIALAAKGEYADAVRGAAKDKLPIVLNNIGYVAMQRGDLTTAEGYLARAMESSPSFNTIASQNIEQLKAKKGDEKGGE